MAIRSQAVVYINGVRFYPQSISISARQGGYLAINVAVPAVRAWQVLPQRSHCAVFFEDPVTKTWRLFGEGEYVGFSTSKTGEGTRSRTLQFQGLHAMWQQARYTNIVTNQEIETVAVSDAQGQQVTKTANGENAYLQSLANLIDNLSRDDTTPPQMLSILMTGLVQQSPVHCFYAYARQLSEKMWVRPDAEIKNVMDMFRFNDLARNQLNSMGVGPNTTLHDILTKLEGILFYQHSPIPAPSRGSDRSIREMYFSPVLYHTVPPACNVIYKDQMQTGSASRDFRREPTRVISNTQKGTNTAGESADANIPNLFMVNHNGGGRITGSTTDDTGSAGVSATHLNLSDLELLQGVQPRVITLEIEKLVQVAEKAETPKFNEAYLYTATQHHFELARGIAKQRELICSFQPYVVPGMSTLLEDPEDPAFGTIEDVSHTLSATGDAMTSLTITFIREAFITDTNRTPYYPVWFNANYRADKIADTYRVLLGANAAAEPRTTMVPGDDIPTTDGGTAARPDLDALASMVIPLERYSINGSLVSHTPADDDANVLANRIRLESQGTPEIAFLRQQYRAGTTLAQYVETHSLPVPVSRDMDFARNEPPLDLAPGVAHELFGAPDGLVYGGADRVRTPDPKWGVYAPANAASPISEERQAITRMILKAVNRPMTRD